jgi:hypothetical protein
MENVYLTRVGMTMDTDVKLDKGFLEVLRKEYKAVETSKTF